MTNVADVFELMHRGADSFQTVRATIRVWHDHEKNQRAFEREIEEEQAADEGTGSIIMLTVGDPEAEPPSAEAEETVRLWLEKPGKRREEADGPQRRVSVTNGVKSWEYSPEFGALEQEADPDDDRGEADALLHPERLLPSVDIEVVGPTSVAGRQGVRLRARRRRAPRRPLFGPLGPVPGADEYDLVVDKERGILLRTEASIDGEPFAISEIVEIAFDESFAPETFQFVPPEGETLHSPEELWGEHEHEFSVEEAAARASFPVWIPSRLPRLPNRHVLGQAWEIQVHYQQGAARPKMPESVSLFYWHDVGTSFTLSETAVREPLDARLPWEAVELDERLYLVWEPEPSRLPVPIQLRVELEGTDVHLSSPELAREELLEVARSLVRAPTEPPSLTG